MPKNSWWWVAMGLALVCIAAGVAQLPYDDPIAQAGMFAPPYRPAKPPVFIPELPELPPAEPSSEVPTLVKASQEQIELRVKALAHEMADMWTRNPEELVVVIDDAARSVPSAPSVDRKSTRLHSS